MIQVFVPESDWRKSTYSGNNGGECVEWSPSYASIHRVVPVRDSKTPRGPILTLTPTAFAGLVRFAKAASI
ncbi:DUF397 domain-containing protein [Streptomyces sp. NPDC020965]|uniref:DUF397 domain-containing protein n=1 Tax=Streptomyces sp. NPDC020965 TaxID=3365105 RepID=UPI0037AC0180